MSPESIEFNCINTVIDSPVYADGIIHSERVDIKHAGDNELYSSYLHFINLTE